MPKAYRSYHPDQDLLLPPSLRDWLTEDHLVYFVSEVVERLNLAAIHAVYGEERRGQPPYDPLLMTKLLVYGYCTGVFSSRKIQKRIQEDIPFKVLAAGNEPDFRTISDFRKIHLKALQGLFEQVLEIAGGYSFPSVSHFESNAIGDAVNGQQYFAAVGELNRIPK